MKEFFKNKRNIALIASGLAIVLAVTGVVIYQTRKPEVEEAGNAVEESDNTDGAAEEPNDTGEENTDGETNGEAVTNSETNGKTDGEAVSDPTKKPDDTTTTTKKPNGTTTTTKKPENKPRPTEPKPTQPKPTNPSNDFVAKNPITGETLPNMPKDLYDELIETVIEEHGSIENYKKEVDRITNYKCGYCGEHNCPGLTYKKDALGNYFYYVPDMDKCPAIINHKWHCPYCGKPAGTRADQNNNPGVYCNGSCQITFG